MSFKNKLMYIRLIKKKILFDFWLYRLIFLIRRKIDFWCNKVIYHVDF